ncbi:MAG: hypothetical protein AAFV26_05190 [Pseudomonadota bacterium]
MRGSGDADGDPDLELTALNNRFLAQKLKLAALQSNERSENYEALSGAAFDEMSEIAWRAASLPAETASGLAIKARLLLAFAEDDPDDITSRLVQSLCSDVLDFADGGRQDIMTSGNISDRQDPT